MLPDGLRDNDDDFSARRWFDLLFRLIGVDIAQGSFTPLYTLTLLLLLFLHMHGLNLNSNVANFYSVYIFIRPLRFESGRRHRGRRALIVYGCCALPATSAESFGMRSADDAPQNFKRVFLFPYFPIL